MTYSSRASMLGTPISISRSNRPALRKAGSSESGRFVAPMTMTVSFEDAKSTDELAGTKCTKGWLTIHARKQLGNYSPFHFSLSCLSLRCDSVHFVKKQDTRCETLS